MKALILSANDFEDTELLVPKYRFEEAGYTVDVASGMKGAIRGMHGYEVSVDKPFDDIVTDEYAVLVLPGGKAPAAIRKDPVVLAIVHHFLAAQKPVGAICHGPQILVSTGLMRNRRATCYRTVAAELKAAGAWYEDSEVVVDGCLVTARQPSDLPAFLRELMKVVAQKAVHATDKYWGDCSPITLEAPLRKIA